VFDECHRAIRDYAYTFVAKSYNKNSNGLILGLTASPGGSEEKINQICNNLFIEAVEVRTETDPDVQPYVKEIDTEFEKVELPMELKSIRENFKNSLNVRLEKLKGYKINTYNKRELLEAQKKISARLAKEKRPIYYHMISGIAEAIKIWHALELLETQSLNSVEVYFERMRDKETKADKRIIEDPGILRALTLLKKYKKEHPKMERLKEMIDEQIKENKNVKIILFSHFRDNIQRIFEVLSGVEGCSPATLIGQAGEKGLSQKEQISVIRDFEDDFYNCLITSPIGEEGLHLASADLAIFYDSVPSEIRTIQRRGRVGRTKVGKIIILLTKNTRDEAYYYSAKRKEKKMKEILKDMQNETRSQSSLFDFK
jgi:Fanconi anemia group M protein